MNVPNISQGPVSAAVLPRAVAAGDVIAPPRTAAVTSGPVRSHLPSPSISLTRLACFDVNGDGDIDDRSASSGGDATLLVPTHEVDLPTWPHAANPMAGPRPAKGHEVRADERATATPLTSVPPAPGASSPANAAQTNRAVGAYQRYGRSPAPNAVVATTSPAPAPAPLGASADLSPAPAPAPGPVPTATGPLSGR